MIALGAILAVQRYLAGIEYPAKKDELIVTAERSGAPQDVIETLQALAREDFEDQSAVEATLG